MNPIHTDIINMICSVINNTEIKENTCNYSELFDISLSHNITTLLYYAFHKNDIYLDEKSLKVMQNIVFKETAINEQQLYYIEKISEQFNENNIDFMLLKGSVLKKLYPHPEIRRMGDIDILIKEEQYQKITKIMQSLGFTFQYESNHELVWKKGNIMIELHKILMPSYNKDLHGYFGNGWKRAILKNKCEYTFSDDDMFIYIFSHFAKHYRDAGIGIIHMCDLYVYLKNIKINKDYVFRELKTLQLYDFYCNIKQTLDVWFEDSETCEMTDYITKVIFNSGAYGLAENVVISRALKGKKEINNIILSKINRVFKIVFPSVKAMRNSYQALKKYPFLLPLFWVIRWGRLIFFERKKVSQRLNDICVVSEQQIREYEDALNYVGLDYNI